jgi:hypothetical protein
MGIHEPIHGDSGIVVMVVMVRKVQVIDGAVVPIVGVPPWQYAVYVMTIDVRGETVVAPVPDL